MFCLLLNTVSGYSHVCCFLVLLQTFKLTTPIALWCRLYLFNSTMSIRYSKDWWIPHMFCPFFKMYKCHYSDLLLSGSTPNMQNLTSDVRWRWSCLLRFEICFWSSELFVWDCIICRLLKSTTLTWFSQIWDIYLVLKNLVQTAPCSVVFSNLRCLSGLQKSPCIRTMFSPCLRNIIRYIPSPLYSENPNYKANMAIQSHLCHVLRKQHADWHSLCRLSLKKNSVTAECFCLVVQNFHLDWCTFCRSLRTIFFKYFLSLPLSQNSEPRSVMQRGISAVCFQK